MNRIVKINELIRQMAPDQAAKVQPEMDAALKRWEVSGNNARFDRDISSILSHAEVLAENPELI